MILRRVYHLYWNGKVTSTRPTCEYEMESDDNPNTEDLKGAEAEGYAMGERGSRDETRLG